MSFAETEANAGIPICPVIRYLEGFKNTVRKAFYFWGADTDTNDRNGRSQLIKQQTIIRSRSILTKKYRKL